MYLRLNRHGRVQTTKSVSNQCKGPGHQFYDYRVRLTCLDNNLDQNKFIVDHQRIHTLITEYFAKKMCSCETICKEIGGILFKKLQENGVNAVDLYIRLTPFTTEVGPNKAFMEWSMTGNF